jgi:ABC-type uncharacterized transport system fused permease/ATPase subunit
MSSRISSKASTEDLNAEINWLTDYVDEHNHKASDITFGTLSSDRLPTVPVTKGGTGATTAAGALTNLGLTATAAELNIMGGVTATTAELNKLDGLTATTTELNYIDGVTSNIQAQLDTKANASALSSYYTKTEIDNMELITTNDIDDICGTTLQVVSLSRGVF